MTLPLRVLIADDEHPARRRLSDVLREHAGIEVVAECATGPSAIDEIALHLPDIAFLDVRMPGCSGIEVAHRLPAGARPLIIFTTAFDQYALDAFEQHAVDYLLKPFTDERLLEALARATEVVRGRQMVSFEARLRALLETWPDGAHEARTPEVIDGETGERLVVRSSGRVRVIDVSDIRWVQADHDHIELHLGTDTIRTRETIRSLLERYGPRRFVQIHRSVIVNLGFIRELDGTRRPARVILSDGTRLRVSRRCRAEVEAALESGQSS